MPDPTKSWALVVGIDQYNDAIVPPLDGAAADAVAAVQWLRGIGVPDKQILLHTVPRGASAAAVAALNLPNASSDATFDAIDASLSTLSDNGGERLFVFLAGHGVYEPSEGRLFLCQDFANRGSLVAKTLKIDDLARYLLSYRFPEQFLFMDGCQNFSYSPAVRQKFRSALDGTSVTPDEASNGLYTVFGASMGQLAQERNGRGAFFGTLFPVLDPKLLAAMPPQQGLGRAISLDFRTGESLVDLEELVGWVRESMQAAGIAQTPNCVKLGTAAVNPIPLLRLSQAQVSEVTLELEPPNAVNDVSEVTVTCDDVQARRRQPAIGSTQVSFPDQFRVPVGTVATIVCRGKQGWNVTPAWERLNATTAQFKVQFVVAQPAPAAPEAPQPARLQVNLRQPDGSPAGEMSGQLYHDLQSQLGPSHGDNVALEHHETGPEFVVTGDSAEDHARATELATNWSNELGRAFAPRNITVAASGTDGHATGIRFALPAGVSAQDIAGPATGSTTVSVAPLGQAPATAAPLAVPIASIDGQEISAAPGATMVRLDLPWGAWSQVVNVPPSGLVRVELPPQVGSAPPLRVELAAHTHHGKRRIYGSADWKDAPPTGTTIDPGGRVRAKLRPVNDPDHESWALMAPGTASMVRLEGSASGEFPLFGDRNFAVADVGGSLQVEPLSDVPSSEWDLLVGSGRLEALSPEDAVRLTEAKWFDDLLGLAGAYAIYAHLRDDPVQLRQYLGIVLSNLANRVGHRSPDLQLLSLYLQLETSPAGSNPEPGLEELPAHRSVPLFRWGVTLALDLLGRKSKLTASERRWEKLLTGIDETISLGSAWTVTTSKPEQ